MTEGAFDRVKKLIQREIDSEKLSTFEYNMLDNFLHEVRREMVNKPVETTNEQPLTNQELKEIRGILADPYNYYKPAGSGGNGDFSGD